MHPTVIALSVAGWDCHGLPVEHEIDKTFSIKGKADVLSMGIGRYNEECHQHRYALLE